MKIIKYLLSIPKTIFFNFRVFPLLTAIKMPIFVANSVKINNIYRGCIQVQGKIRPLMITIGMGGSKAIFAKKGMIHISKKDKANIIFKGKANFAEGIVLYVKGKLIFGKNFSANRNCFISSDNDMTFGEDVLIGWNVNIRDSDGHKIVYQDKKTDKDSNVQIGNHVWICAYSDILKGSKIANDCVVAYRSCVLGLETTNNTLVGGYPAKKIKDNINWIK